MIYVILIRMNLLDASIEVSLAGNYPTIEFAVTAGVLNPKREKIYPVPV
jgi:hypothetical protein